MVIQNELAAIVGKEWVGASEDTHTFAVDNVCPAFVVYPGSVEELAAVLRRAHESEWIVIPAGFGSGLGLGNYLSHVDLAISTQRLNQIIEYTPEDLTAGIQAGCSLAAFNAVLQEHGQWLPLDPPRPERASVGAIAATGDFGPLRLGFGVPRDYVIGTQLVQADGTIIKTGGRVVKNVAGYDLNKLFVGSLGTLGIITQLNFKLRPLPQADATRLTYAKTLEDLHQLAGSLTASELSPAAVVSCSSDMAKNLSLDSGEQKWIVLIRFLDSEAAVDYQLKRWDEIVKTSTAMCEQVEPSRADVLWQRIRDLRAEADGNIVLRIHVRPSDVVSIFSLLEKHLSDQVDDLRIASYHRAGIIIACAHVENVESARPTLDQLRHACQAMNGSMIIERAHAEIKRSMDVWGDAGSSIGMMRSLKKQFDPKRILNPGRFVGGI